MSQPLPVAGAGRGSDAATVEVGEVQGETGVPSTPALGVQALEVGEGERFAVRLREVLDEFTQERRHGDGSENPFRAIYLCHRR